MKPEEKRGYQKMQAEFEQKRADNAAALRKFLW